MIDKQDGVVDRNKEGTIIHPVPNKQRSGSWGSSRKPTKIKIIQKPVKTIKSLAPATIFEYIRRRKAGKTFKVGIVIGVAQDHKINVGWSKCNVKEDKFTYATGSGMAYERAIGLRNSPPAPLCIRTQLRRFGGRCVRYFKDANQLVLPS